MLDQSTKASGKIRIDHAHGLVTALDGIQTVLAVAEETLPICNNKG